MCLCVYACVPVCADTFVLIHVHMHTHACGRQRTRLAVVAHAPAIGHLSQDSLALRLLPHPQGSASSAGLWEVELAASSQNNLQ